MTQHKFFMGLLLCSTFSSASSLAVYQDSAFYNYTATSNFIGFTQGVHVKCEGSSISQSALNVCPEDNRLCTLVKQLEETKKEIRVIDSNEKVLKTFVTLPQPQVIDANEWIVSARLIGQEQAVLLGMKEKLHKKLKEEERVLQKQIPSPLAKKTDVFCNGELELTIPYGQISFSTSYEADIADNEITVTQNLHIVNRSGVDIEADTAMFYYRKANQYLRTMHFSPWVVRKFEPQKRRMYKKAKVNAAPMMELSMAADNVASGDVMPTSVVSYEDAREYKITNLSLPSIGLALDKKVQTWQSTLKCEIKAYPYMNSKAFEVCTFSPKQQIDANEWKVKSGTKVINENATGEYREGKYNLYTKIEEDIKIVRTPIVKKERETGIFGGTARKKDGFIFTITNKSKKVKKLTVVERIPTSTSSEIKSKLLSVHSDSKIDYKVLKDGKIEMQIMLSANESKKIEVLFELSYDKDVKVRY